METMQQLIKTEMHVRQRLLKGPGTQATVDAARSQGERTTRSLPETSIYRQGGEGDGSTIIIRSPEKPALAADSGSVDGWFGAGAGSGGGGGFGKKGLRHELRVQMNIERKRARLFEDIQTLPYA